MNPQLDHFFNKPRKWQPEMQLLRKLVLSCGLTEELKWYQPCYTYNGTNLIIIGAFKEYCVLSFLKGALLKDTHGILTKPGANTQSARVIKFTGAKQITELEAVIKAYILETIALEKQGVKVKFKKIEEHNRPPELEAILKHNRALKTAFEALTPGRQRAYLLHFSSAKQAATRIARIEKCTPQIMKGKGLNEDYAKRK